MTQVTSHPQIIKRRIVRKRIPASDIGSDTTLSRSASDLTETTEKASDVVPVHTNLVHTHIKVAPLDKYSSNAVYTGFVNLMILLFTVMVGRLIFENYRKYGILLHVPMISYDQLTFFISSFSLQMLHYAIGYWIEASRQTIKTITNSMRWHSINALFIIIEQTWYVGKYCNHPGIGIGLLLFASILVLKLFSFAFVTTNEHKPVASYDYFRFLFVPTLCFQYSYPKSPTRSWLKVMRYFVEFILSITCMIVITQQYAEPTLATSILKIKSGELNIGQLLDRIMKLSLSVSLIWLSMFYGLFHAYLYFWAEITQFGDRQFYREWWNASDLGTYWRLWYLIFI